MNQDLIYDVGMHRGKDTEFYLRKGFRVVAIEANPALVKLVANNLASDVASGRLKIVECAIADKPGTAEFWINTNDDLWSSLSKDHTASWTDQQRIEVEARTFDTVLTEYGVPYYLKVDIEGADLLCLAALARFPTKPKFVSFECSLDDFEQTFEALSTLWQLGYRRFKLVNQARHPSVRVPNPPLEGDYVDMRFDGSMSGPFGEEAPGEWIGIEELVERRLRLGKEQALRRAYAASGRVFGIPMHRFHDSLKGFYNSPPVRVARETYAQLRGRESGGWFDIHARLG